MIYRLGQQKIYKYQHAHFLFGIQDSYKLTEVAVHGIIQGTVSITQQCSYCICEIRSKKLNVNDCYHSNGCYLLQPLLPIATTATYCNHCYLLQPLLPIATTATYCNHCYLLLLIATTATYCYHCYLLLPLLPIVTTATTAICNIATTTTAAHCSHKDHTYEFCMNFQYLQIQ